MADNHIRRAVGTFSDRAQAEAALGRLRDAGFDMSDVSVITRDGDRQDDIAGADVKDAVGNRAGEGAATGATTGGVLGGLTGLLVGLGALAIPGIGPVMTAGAVGTAIATTLSGGAIGAAAGSLVGALVGLGIPKERAETYNAAVARGDFLVVVDGTAEEINEAERILSGSGIRDYGVFDAPAGSYDATRYRDRTTLSDRARNLGSTGTETWGRTSERRDVL